MTFAVKQDMEVRFKLSELLDLTNPNDMDAIAINDAVLQIALDDATNEINIHLTGYSDTLHTNPPAILTNICCTIARYNLYSGASTEEVENRYKNAIKLLKSIADGSIDIGANLDNTDSPSFSKPESVFTVGMMRGET